MIDDVEIIALADRDRWMEVQHDGGLPAQSWSYAHALQASGVEPRLACVKAGGARLLLPFCERDWNGHRHLSTLIGLSGASLTPPSAAPLALWAEFARTRGWVAGYLHFGHALPSLPATLAIPLATHVVYELDLATADPFASASAIVRRKVRKAEAIGVGLVDDPEAVAAALPRLYRAASWRQSASGAYALSDETLHRWARSPAILALGARIGDRVEAVSLFPFSGGRAEFHMNASSDAGRALGTWLIREAAVRFAERGVASLNIGGGITIGDSLDDYKARFRGRPREVHTIGQVYDRSRYEALCGEAGVDPSANGWFPAYARGAIPAKGEAT